MYKITGMDRSFFRYLVAGIVVMGLMWGFNATGDYTGFLSQVVSNMHNLPKIISSHLLILTSLLGVFIKTAPLFAILFCLRERKGLYERVKILSVWKVIKVFAAGLTLFIIFSFFIVFLDYDMAGNTRRIYKIVSVNQFFVFWMYAFLFAGYYSISIAFICTTFVLPLAHFKKNGR